MKLNLEITEIESFEILDNLLSAIKVVVKSKKAELYYWTVFDE